MAQRFGLRVDLMGDFVTSYTADLIKREQVQATVSLSDPAVSTRDFERAVAGFGYAAAVLLDAQGRALQVLPAPPPWPATERVPLPENLRRGLSLYLVRQLAQAGGLDVSYQPNQPRGAAFIIAVPCTPTRPATGGSPQQFAASPQAHRSGL